MMNGTRLVLCLFLFVFAVSPAFSALPDGHPRLLMDAEQAAAMRERIKDPQVAPIFAAIKARADAKRFDPQTKGVELYYDMHVRDWAQMYLLTGERKYADEAAVATRALIDDEAFWNNPRSKGLTRAAGAWSVALAYDLCHDAWPEKLRREVSRELLEIAKEMMQSMGAGANTRMGNNWQGVRYGAAGLAALACDEPGREEVAREAYQLMLRHLRANVSADGWNPEGIGYMIYPATFTGPFGIAAQRAGLGDVREDVPAYAKSYWASLAGTVNIPQIYGHGLRADLADDHPGYKPDGTLGLSFFYAPQELTPAIKWMYDYLVGERGDESYDVNDWAGGLYSLLYYPTESEAQNPAEVAGLQQVYGGSGVAIFRERFQDEGDIVALVNATQRRADGGHAGPDVNTFRILGRGGFFVTGGGRTGDTAGQTNLFIGEPPSRGTNELGELVEVQLDEDTGGGHATVRGSSMGVTEHERRFSADYSGAAGVPALFLNSETSLNGKLWRMNTPQFNDITLEDNRFIITSPNGATFAVTVLEPAKATFRTGTVERGGGLGHAGFPYRGKKYANNKYIEFEVDKRAAVLMTLQDGPPPAVAVAHGIHGAKAQVGGVTIIYEKESGRLYPGDADAAAQLLQRAQPLRPVGLAAEARGDRAVRLSWQTPGEHATTLRVQRRPADDEQAAFEDLATVGVDEVQMTDRHAEPATAYAYRLVAVNDAGRSTPSEPASARTFDAGYQLLVEDFAPAAVKDANRLGDWTFSNTDRGWEQADAPGSPRLAQAEAGYLSTGSVRINHSNVFYTDDVRFDLSGPTAAILIDWRAQAVTQFGVLLKLADGRWVVSGQAYLEKTTQAWRTQRYDLAQMSKWWHAEVTGPKKGDPVKLTRDDLSDVRGIGFWASWPINQKWAHVDQLTVIGRPLE